MSVDTAQQRIRALLQQADGLAQQRSGVLQEAATLARQYGLPYAGRRERETARAQAHRRGRSEEERHGHE